MKPRVLLVLLALATTSACASSQATVQSPVTADHRDEYAAAVTEAFSNYEREVATAASLTYSSQAEAEAVIRTLSTERFDWQLRQSLARRGLTLRGLAELAVNDASFFHTQQRMHWGELDQLQQKVAAIATHVQAPELDESLFALDMTK